MEEITKFLQGKDYVTWPIPLKVDWPRKNTSLYCNFPKEAGHTTDVCRELKKKVHNLIQKWYLKELQSRPIQKVVYDPSTSARQAVVDK